MNFIGVDPGKSGGIAIIRKDGSVSVAPFDEYEYRTLISCLDGTESDTVVCVESVHAFSGQGVNACFNFGQNFGWIQGLLFAYGLETILVSPMRWKKHFDLVFSKDTDKKVKKQASIAKARELFPDISLRKTARCKTDDDGIAEALLIAKYLADTYHRV